MSQRPKTDPRPIRKPDEWAQAELLKECTNSEMVSMFAERVIIVCRECFGFGHSRSKCPTRVKLDRISFMSAAGKSLVGNYRFLCSKKKKAKSRAVWMMPDIIRQWQSASGTEADIAAAAKYAKELVKYVCFTCSGHGHTATDFQYSKRNKKIPKCPASKYVEVAYRYCTDKDSIAAFKEEMKKSTPGTKKKRENKVLGFKRRVVDRAEAMEEDDFSDPSSSPQVQQVLAPAQQAPAPVQQVLPQVQQVQNQISEAFQSIGTIYNNTTWREGKNFAQVKDFADALVIVNNRYNQNIGLFIYNRIGYRVNIGVSGDHIVLQLEVMNAALNAGKETDYAEAKMKFQALIIQQVVYVGSKLMGTG